MSMMEEFCKMLPKVVSILSQTCIALVISTAVLILQFIVSMNLNTGYPVDSDHIK